MSQVEKAKPKLLQSALKSAMSDFGDKVEEELAPSSPNARRRSSVQHTAAASMRKLERDVERDEARDGGARTSIPGSMRLKIRNLISALHLRTSSRVAVDTPAVVLLLPLIMVLLQSHRLEQNNANTIITTTTTTTTVNSHSSR